MTTKLDGLAEAEAPMLPSVAPETRSDGESLKRKQILDGARRVFLSAGFAAASMGEIAREAQVSKGTLYVYFDGKEALFAALIEETTRETAERLLDLDQTMTDVRKFLTLLATRLMEKFCSPTHISMVRMVMGAAEKFPHLSRQFYEAGAGHGHARLSGWLAEQHAAGRLNVPEPELAAWQFLSICCHPLTVRVTMGGLPVPDAVRIASYSDAAVTTFLAAFGPATRT